MKWDERDIANAIFFNEITGDIPVREGMKVFPGYKLGKEDPAPRNRNHGSQNYDISMRAALRDFDWFKKLYDDYRSNGLHSLEFGPGYLPHHLMAWKWMENAGMHEAHVILRATWMILAMMGTPVPVGTIKVVGVNGPEELKRPGYYREGVNVLPVGERTSRAELRDNMLNQILSEVMGRSTVDKREMLPLPVRPPVNKRIQTATGGTVATSSYRWGPFYKLLYWGESREFIKLLDGLMGGDMLALREAEAIMRFPYAGCIQGLIEGPYTKAAVSMQQLNRNKPPIEYARCDGEEMTIFRGGRVKGVRARGGKVVGMVHGETITIADEDGAEHTLKWRDRKKRGIEWEWDGDGLFIYSNHPVESVLVGTGTVGNIVIIEGEQLVEPKEKKKSWIRRVIDAVISWVF